MGILKSKIKSSIIIILLLLLSSSSSSSSSSVDGGIILRWIFGKLERVVGTGWNWLRIGMGGGHLWVR